MSISYSAIVLDARERQDLLDLVSRFIPEGWEEIGHHMTITMGPLVHPKESKRAKGHDYSDFGPVGTEHTLSVTHIGSDERAMAVKVASPFLTQNEKKGDFAHITIAVNREGGGKPFHSNKIPDDNFKTITDALGVPELTVKGTVQEIPQ